MILKYIIGAALALIVGAAHATTVTTTDTTSVADTLACEAGTGGITVKKCAGPVTAAQIITSTDTSSVADTLMCEAGIAGVTGKKCAGPITASQVGTTADTTSTVGHLLCEAGTGGKTFTDCGVAPTTTIAAYSILMNATASAANPTEVSSPTFHGGSYGFHNDLDSSNASRITLRNVAPTVGGSSVAIQTEFINTAATAIGSGTLKLYSDVLTAAAETSHWLAQTIQGGAVSNEWGAGGGMIVGSPAAYKGVGTLVAEKGIWPGTGTVSGLPTCNSTAKGQIRFVTDANSTTFNATAAGSGSNAMLALCDGSLWKIR